MNAPARYGNPFFPLNLPSLPYLIILSLLVIAAPCGVFAKATTWTGGGITDDWSDLGNWDNGVPVSGDDVSSQAVGGDSFMDISGLTLNAIDMTGFSGILHLMQPLSVTGDAVFAGDVMVNANLTVAGDIEIASGGSMYQMADVATLGSGMIHIDSSSALAVNGYSLTTRALAVNGTVDFTSGTVSLFSIWLWGTATGSGANVYVESLIDGAGSLTLTNSVLTVEGGLNAISFTNLDLTGTHLFIDGSDYGLGVGTGHTLGSVTIQSYSPSSRVYVDSWGAWNGITGDLTIIMGTVDLRYADLIVHGSTTISAGGTIDIPSSERSNTHEFGGGLVINDGAFVVGSPGATIKIGDGEAVDVNGTGSFRVHGGLGGGRISLSNTSAATQWNFDPDGTATTYIRNANIEWGNSLDPITVYNCVDAGNNTGFTFVEPEIAHSDTALAYGAVTVGVTAYDTVMIYNLGTDSLTVSSITNSLPEFVPSPTFFVVLPGDSQAVAVSFSPPAIAAYVDSLVITSDDQDEGVRKVYLSGDGAMPDLVAQPITAFVGELTSGTDSIFVLWGVKNDGGVFSPPFRHSLRISADTTIDAADVILATTDLLVDLLPGWTSSDSDYITFPKAAPRGNVYLGLIADDLGQVLESDETNNTYRMAFSYQVPLINSVLDVPLDQGGSVFLSWYASPRDPLGAITEYTLWRTIDVPPAAAEGTTVIDGAAAWSSELEGRVIRMEKSPSGPVFWEHIATHGAFRRDAYGMALPSLFDSTGAGFAYQYFQVIAHTASPDTFYLSAIDSGYSVDNLAPAAPQNLAGEQTEPEGMQLSWDANTEADLSHYAVYRGTDPGFVPATENLVGESGDPALFDDEWRWDAGFYYKVTAIDVHGNASPVAELAPDLVVGVGDTEVPRANALWQNRPNPFSATTTIAFDLEREADVSICIYDVKGRLVRTLLEGRRSAKHHTVDWAGLDNHGNPVAGGVYFYRITAGPFVQVKKLIVIR